MSSDPRIGTPAARRIALLAAAWLVASGFGPRAATPAPLAEPTEGVRVRWQTHASQQTGNNARPPAFVEVLGLAPPVLKALQLDARDTAAWRKHLAVFAEPSGHFLDPTLPPMAGTYAVTNGALRFTPAFPLRPGVRYRALFQPGTVPGFQGETALAIGSVYEAASEPSTPSTVVLRIAPSAAVVPENLLKFYLHFSAPMSRGHIYDHIHLRNEKGESVELPFLEIDEELWNPEMTRLTLFLDPGRIKRGVKPLEEVGSSLQEGAHYTLVIDAAWQDAEGQPLKSAFEKVFSVGPPDREPPDPKAWKMATPLAGSRDALTVLFSEPMDDALARRLVHVGVGDSGVELSGRVELANEERTWRFLPDAPWKPGPHRLLVAGTLEDLAGNNPGKPFEVDLFEGIQRRITTETVSVPFTVR